MKARDLPNLISFARILLSLPIVWLLYEREFSYALILFAVAGFSDGLDGFLAKHFHWQSHLGGLLDPLADKALLMSSFLVLGGLGLIPIWLVILVIFRDLTIMGGALYYHFSVEEVDADQQAQHAFAAPVGPAGGDRRRALPPPRPAVAGADMAHGADHPGERRALRLGVEQQGAQQGVAALRLSSSLSTPSQIL